jgi:hypothetical protein
MRSTACVVLSHLCSNHASCRTVSVFIFDASWTAAAMSVFI